MSNRTFVALVVSSCFLSSVPLTGQSRTGSAPAACASTTKVTIAHWGQERILIYLPLYVAIDGGFFSDECLDVTLKYSGNDDQVFATVISGGADFGVGDPAFTAISRERGGPGRVVALLVGAVANWGVAMKDSKVAEISNPQQLQGLRVSSFPSPSTTFTILTELRKKYRLSTMQIRQMASGTELAALQRGDVDLAVMLEPQTSIAESMGYRVVWSVAKYYGPFALTGVTTSDDMIARHRDIVQGVVTALQRALNFIHQEPQQTVDIVAKSFPSLPRRVIEAALKRMTEDLAIPQTVQISPEAWKKSLALRVAVGDLNSLSSGQGALDNEFADNAQSLAAKENDSAHPSAPTPSETRPYLLQPVEVVRWRDWLAFAADIITLVLFAAAVYLFVKVRRAKIVLEEAERGVGKTLLERLRPGDQIKYSTVLSQLRSDGIGDAQSEAVIRRLRDLKLLKLQGSKVDPYLSLSMPGPIDTILGGDDKPLLRRYVD